MSIFKDFLVLQNQVCFYGNQYAVILMLCKILKRLLLYMAQFI